MSGLTRPSEAAPRPGFHAGWLWLHPLEETIQRMADLGFAVVVFRANRRDLHPNQDGLTGLLERLDRSAESHNVDLILDLHGEYLFDPNEESRSDDGPNLADATRWVASWRRRLAPLRRWKKLWVDAATYPRTGDWGANELPDRLADWFEAINVVEPSAESSENRPNDDSEPSLVLTPRADSPLDCVNRWIGAEPWLARSAGGCGWRLNADVGEMLRAAEIPIADRLLACRDLDSVVLCDRPTPGGGDVMFGQGQVVLPSVVRTLRRGGWCGDLIYRYAQADSTGWKAAEAAMASFEAS